MLLPSPPSRRKATSSPRHPSSEAKGVYRTTDTRMPYASTYRSASTPLERNHTWKGALPIQLVYLAIHSFTIIRKKCSTTQSQKFHKFSCTKKRIIVTSGPEMRGDVSVVV